MHTHKVTIRDDLKVGERYGGSVFTRDMELYKGQPVTVVGAHLCDGIIEYILSEDAGMWLWTSDMFTDRDFHLSTPFCPGDRVCVRKLNPGDIIDCVTVTDEMAKFSGYESLIDKVFSRGSLWLYVLGIDSCLTAFTASMLEYIGTSREKKPKFHSGQKVRVKESVDSGFNAVDTFRGKIVTLGEKIEERDDTFFYAVAESDCPEATWEEAMFEPCTEDLPKPETEIETKAREIPVAVSAFMQANGLTPMKRFKVSTSWYYFDECGNLRRESNDDRVSPIEFYHIFTDSWKVSSKYVPLAVGQEFWSVQEDGKTIKQTFLDSFDQLALFKMNNMFMSEEDAVQSASLVIEGYRKIREDIKTLGIKTPVDRKG